MGSGVLLTGQAGDWSAVALNDGSTGWVSTRYLSASPQQSATSSGLHPASVAPKKPAYDRGQVIQAIIARSQAGYPGRCPCPDNLDRAGRRCGGRSAYSRAGGYGPLCYSQDVTQQMIDEFLAQLR
jgi:hypothetical protein